MEKSSLLSSKSRVVHINNEGKSVKELPFKMEVMSSPPSLKLFIDPTEPNFSGGNFFMRVISKGRFGSFIDCKGSFDNYFETDKSRTNG